MDRARRIVVSGMLLGALVGLPACGSGGTSDPGELVGVEWVLSESSVSSTDLGAAGITATFDGQRIGGFSGVNQYGGPYTARDDGSFEVGEISSTMMAGPEPLMRAETAYVTLLQECDSYEVRDGKLTLSTGGNATLVYEPAKPAELAGTSWLVTGYNNGKQAVTSPSAGSTLTVDFGSDGTVSGNAGVNTFTGPYEVDGKAVQIGPLATTRMMGPEDLMTQETAFLTALENSSTWEISQGRLTMRDSQGATQITANPRP